MTNFARDIRVALRGLRRTPTFTIAAVLILGLGIGTSVAMFTVFRAVLLDRLPVRDPSRVVVLTTYKDPAVEFGLTERDVKTVAQQSRTITDIGGYAHWGTTRVPLVDGDRSLILGRVLVSGTFFGVLGARPAVGRFLGPDDDLAGAAKVMVLSYNAWHKQFNGNPAIVGHRLYEPYGQQWYTIVGVAPPGLEYPAGSEYWIPLWGDGLSVIAVARLAPGATPAAARSEFFSIVARTESQLNLKGAKVVGFTQAMLGDVRPIILVLTAAVGLLLLIACVNVGNLLLLRAGSRARELAIRRALGATYAHVVRQLLLESALLAACGGVLGLICAEALLRAVVVVVPAQVPRLDQIQLAGMPIVAAIGVTLVAVILFGVAPSLAAARSDVASTLRLDARSGRDSAARRRVRHVLVAAQATLALVMLAAAVLLARSLGRLEVLSLGYASDHLTILSATWPSKTYDSSAKLYPIAEDVTRRWRSIPGVEAVTPVLIPPLVGADVFVSRLDLDGQSDAERAANPFLAAESGGPEYFRTFGIPIIRGRGFTDDDRENAPLVAVVSQAVARRFWPNDNPVGKRIHYWGAPDSTAWRTVIGVAGDVHLRTLREPTPTIFLPWRQMDFFQNIYAVRTSGTLASVLPAIRRELHAAEPRMDLWYAKPMDELLDAPLAQPRMSALLMSAFGAAALLLAAIGLYGLMASVVRERTRELGIRMALGAAPERLRREVLGQALAVAGSGVAVGVVAALATSRLLTNLLFEVSPTDPVALAVACGTLLLVALVAAYLPARWATRIDPASALRAD